MKRTLKTRTEMIQFMLDCKGQKVASDKLSNVVLFGKGDTLKITFKAKDKVHFTSYSNREPISHLEVDINGCELEVIQLKNCNSLARITVYYIYNNEKVSNDFYVGTGEA